MKIGKKIGGKPQDVIMVWWSSPKLEETNKGKNLQLRMEKIEKDCELYTW